MLFSINSNDILGLATLILRLAIVMMVGPVIDQALVLDYRNELIFEKY